MQAVFLSKNKQALAKTLSLRKMLPIRELLIRYLKGKKSPCKAEHYAIIKFQVKKQNPSIGNCGWVLIVCFNE
jgi:hypothetical protein